MWNLSKSSLLLGNNYQTLEVYSNPPKGGKSSDSMTSLPDIQIYSAWGQAWESEFSTIAIVIYDTVKFLKSYSWGSDIAFSESTF